MSWPSRFENLEESSQAMIHSLSKETEKRLTPVALPEMNLPDASIEVRRAFARGTGFDEGVT